VINHPIYELYVMQLISTVEADSKVILLLVNLVIIRLSTNSLANVSIRKINVGKGFLPKGRNGLP